MSPALKYIQEIAEFYSNVQVHVNLISLITVCDDETYSLSQFLLSHSLDSFYIHSSFLLCAHVQVHNHTLYNVLVSKNV